MREILSVSLWKRVRSVVPGLAVVGLAAGWSGCCCSGTKTIATVDSPLKMEWVVRKGWVPAGGGRGALLPYRWSIESLIKVHASPEYEIRAKCREPSPELVVAPEGTRVAYRCDAAEDWSLVYLGTQKRYFPDCSAKPGTGKLDWAKVPMLRDRAADLLPCLDLCWWARPGYDEYEENVFAELALQLSPSEMVQVLVQSAERRACKEIHWDLSDPDAWDDTMARLPAPERDKVVEELAARLTKVDPSEPPLYLLWRYSRWTRTAHEAVAPRMLSWIDSIWKGDKEVSRHQRAYLVDYMLLRLAPVLRQETAVAACRLLKEAPERTRALFLAIANGQKACPATVHQRLPYTKVAFCKAPGDRQVVCSEQEVAQLVKENLEQQTLPFEKPKHEHDAEELSKIVLAAAYAQGPLPAWVQRLERRTQYRLDQPSSVLCCSSAEASCLCVDPRKLASELPRDEDKTEVEVVGMCCSLLIDDARGRITVKNTSVARTQALGDGGD